MRSITATGSVSLTIESESGVIAEINVPLAIDLEAGVIHLQGRLDQPPVHYRGPGVERHLLRVLRCLLPLPLLERLPEALTGPPAAARDRRQATA